MKIQSFRQTARSALPILVIVGVLVFTGYGLRFAPVQVRGLTTSIGAVTNEIMGTGTLEARVHAAVSPKIQGRIASLHVDQNDFIKRDQCLVTLDDGELRELVEVAAANLGAAEASVARAKADRDRVAAIEKQARLDHKRVSELLVDKVASQSDLDKAVERFEVAEADLKRSESAEVEAERQMIAAQRTLQYQRERLKDTRILSPVDGLVLKRNREAGDVVVPGSSILDVISTNELWIAAWVDETALPQMHVGQRARIVFRSEPGTAFEGEVVRIGRETDRETRELLVDVLVNKLPRNWAVGQRAEVFIEAMQNSSAVSVPAESVQWRNGRPGVFVRKNGRASWREVEVGARGQARVEILSGVTKEDFILIEAKPGTLRDGKRVRIL